MCYGNGMTQLLLPASDRLERIYCYENNLSALNVKQLPALTRLYCYENPLGYLDLTGNKNLVHLVCYKDQLKTLDLSQCEKLHVLECDENEISHLDLSANTDLEEVYCYKNAITGQNMDDLITSLCDRKAMENRGKLCLFNDLDGEETNVCSTLQVQKAREKGWDVYCKSPAGWKIYEGSEPSSVRGVAVDVDEIDVIYDTQGHQLKNLCLGVNIVRTTSGEIRKVFMTDSKEIR